MQNFIQWILSAELAQALCRTLAHSLWQGIVLAVLAGITISVTRKKSAVLRYNLLALQFGLFMLAVAATFIWQWQQEEPATLVVNLQELPERAPIASDAPVLTDAMPGNWTIRIDEFFNRHALLIVSLWSLILCWKCFQMISGIHFLRKVRRTKNRPAEQHWQRRLQVLAGHLQLNKTIRLLESEIITVPMVIGFFSPVVLVPVGLLSGLTPGQVEAILLHELAHIRRKDFIFNLIQCFAETLFFFNPGLLWVSALIRDERENCCDDMAVAVLENKKHYVKALVAFQEFNLQASTMAVAFPGRKYTLLDRVKRIIHHQHTKTLSIMEKISLVTSLLIVGAIAFFPACQSYAQNPGKSPEADFRSINIDGSGTASDPLTVYARDRAGKTYQYKKVDDKVTEMYVDMEKIPQEKWGDYNWVVQDIDKQIAEDMAEAEEDMRQAEEDQRQAMMEMEQAKVEMEEAIREQENDMRQMEEDMRQAEIEMREAKEMAAAEQEQAVRDMQEAEIEMKRAREEMARDMEQAKRDIEQSKRDMEEAKREIELAKVEMKKAQEDSKLMQQMLEEIVKDQLVKDKSAIKSVGLNDKDFEINGQQQSEAMHKKYKAKYLKNKEGGFYYNFSLKRSE